MIGNPCVQPVAQVGIDEDDDIEQQHENTLAVRGFNLLFRRHGRRFDREHIYDIDIHEIGTHGKGEAYEHHHAQASHHHAHQAQRRNPLGGDDTYIAQNHEGEPPQQCLLEPMRGEVFQHDRREDTDTDGRREESHLHVLRHPSHISHQFG